MSVDSVIKEAVRQRGGQSDAPLDQLVQGTEAGSVALSSATWLTLDIFACLAVAGWAATSRRQSGLDYAYRAFSNCREFVLCWKPRFGVLFDRHPQGRHPDQFKS
jgi:hypothetical protein